MGFEAVLHPRSQAESLEDKGRGCGSIDQVIDFDREALECRSPSQPEPPVFFISLAKYLSDRYHQLGNISDLDEATVLAAGALDLCPRGHPVRSSSLSILAVCLSIRYMVFGNVKCLDKGIVLSREALGCQLQGHPERLIALGNLAVHLSIRYEQLGAMEDLDEAILLQREALDLCPKGHSDRSLSLNNLAAGFSTRYRKLGIMEDLNKAIVLNREALELCSQGHPIRSMSLNNLAIHLTTRYERLGVIQDLNDAIVIARAVLELHPRAHRDRSKSLNNLALHLSTRYEQLGSMEDLNEAIVLVREALDLRPQGHPEWSKSLDNLARHLCERITKLEQPLDKEEIFSLYARLVQLPQIISSRDISTARAWAHIAEKFQHPTTLLAYETSLRLLVQYLAILPSLPRHFTIIREQTSSLAVDAFSACLRYRSPLKAVELLEQGRGAFWAQLTRLRPPLDDVIASGMAGKELADRFTCLASIICKTLHSCGADEHERMCHLCLEMQTVVTKIRGLPGLSNFLLPSPFSDLRCAASGGPVIIVNASKYGCDALVILLDCDPIHIPLQITLEGVQELSKELDMLMARATTLRIDVTRALSAFLRKLWDQIVSRIVTVLQTTQPFESRIWWCPTGEFSSLPLHAAGPYRKGQQNLPSLYISSYTPTLTALVRAIRPDPLYSTTTRRRFLAIGQAKASGERELPSVGVELEDIAQCIRDVATVTRIDGEESCISRVVQELGKNEWVHLACHGLPNQTQPFESAFALHDGHFTIQKLIKCELKNPEFAYLSACHTTVGDEESPDEVVHLASAMQFIGFRSVIGTLWAVDDAETNKITSMFYQHMVDKSGRLDHTRAALALNRTMKSVCVPLDQRILYIHLGA